MISFLKKSGLSLYKLFEIDLRSLALFRICLGLILIVDLIIRATSITAHYSDNGVLPRDVFLTRFEYEDWYYSLHYMSGETSIIAILFVIAGILALGLTLGYKTKTCAILSFVFLISLHNRNQAVIHGGDSYLRVLLFWALFLPLGAKWSIDNWRKKVNIRNINAIVSFGCLAILLQIVSLYVQTGIFKDHPYWAKDFTAIYYALSIDQFTTPIGDKLVQYHELTKALTAITLYLEKYGMILFFIPFLTKYFRILGLIIFLGFHLLGINLTMELGIFHYVCSAALLLFMPSFFWDKIVLKLASFLSKFSFYTKMEGFKNSSIQFIKSVFIAENNTEISLSKYAVFKQKAKKVTYWFEQGFVLILAIYILLWNLREVNAPYGNYLSYEHNWVARVLRIDQRWNLFSPFPMTDDGWFVVVANLSDGSQVDLFRNSYTIDFSKPKDVSADFKSERWQKYMMNLWSTSYIEYRPYYLDYLHYNWNKKNPDARILDIEFFYMLENTPPMGLPTNPPQKISLLKKMYGN